ncbi:hypothetical protein GQ472_04050 [archaeon]|nr:hypothetical protein [archaeon]
MDSSKITIIAVIILLVSSYAVYQHYQTDDSIDAGTPVDTGTSDDTGTSVDTDTSDVQMPSAGELASLREDLFAFKTSMPIYVDSYGLSGQQIPPSTFNKAATKDTIQKTYINCAGECPYEFLHYMIWFSKNIDEMSDKEVLAAYPIKARFEKYRPQLTYDNIKDVSYYVYSKKLMNLMSDEEEAMWFGRFIELPAPVTDEQGYYTILFFSDAGDISGLKEKLSVGPDRFEAYSDIVSDKLCGSDIADEGKSGCNYVYSIKNNHFCSLDTETLREEANEFMRTEDITCRYELKYMLNYGNPDKWFL